MRLDRLLDKKTPIVKLIDFGFAMNTNTDFDGGTAHYLAPDTFTTSKTSRSFDGYSLGITFYQLLYPLDDSILFSTTQQFANKYARNQFYKTRVATANSMSLSAKLSYEKNKQDINRLARMTMSSVIARLVKVNASERVDLPTVVTELEKTLKLINPNSLYLEENEEQLFGSIYTDSRYMFERYTKNFVQSEDGIFSKLVCGCTSSRKSSKKDKVNQIAAAQITQIEPVLSFNYPNTAKTYHQNDLGATYREYTNPLKVDKGAVRKLNRIKMI